MAKKLIISRKQILESLVRSLKEFGYPSVNEANILTDQVYKMFAERQLKEALDAQPWQIEIEKMLKEVSDDE